MSESPAKPDAYALSIRAIRRSFERAAATYDEAAVLQRRVGEQLIERLDVVAIEPRVVVDAGCATGATMAPLGERFPGARVVGVDIAWRMLRRAGQRGAQMLAVADGHRLPFADCSVDVVFSNLMLPWCDIDAVLIETRRVLRSGGLYMFSALGPDTLHELRSSWAAADDHSHVNLFADMHDIGDALLHAGFADPVMDVDRYTLTYATVADLMHDLQASGARNTTAGRARTLTGKGRLVACAAHYERYRSSGRLPATCEVVYGQAWAGEQLQRAGPDGAVQVPVGRITHRR